MQPCGVRWVCGVRFVCTGSLMHRLPKSWFFLTSSSTPITPAVPNAITPIMRTKNCSKLRELRHDMVLACWSPHRLPCEQRPNL